MYIVLASKYQAVYRVDPGIPYKWKGPIYDDDDDNNNNNWTKNTGMNMCQNQ